MFSFVFVLFFGVKESFFWDEKTFLCHRNYLQLIKEDIPQLINSNWNFTMLLYFVVYFIYKLWMHFQVGSLMHF